MIVWNHDRTAIVNVDEKDIKLDILNGKTIVVASDTSGKYILYSGDNWLNYFATLAVLLRPMDLAETVNAIPSKQ